MVAINPRQSPSLLLALAESRAIVELGSFHALKGLMKRLPKGDGHPVIVLPGFLASDASTSPLRGLLAELDYSVHGWGLGRNLTFTPQREAEMQQLLKRIYISESQKVSIVGWSLGGVFARELAKSFPDYVRSVITLGSPLSGNLKQTNATGLFHIYNQDFAKRNIERLRSISTPPPVPTTSIYTKSDGVVHWQGSIQEKSEQTENIRVAASHCGLGVNPLAIYAVADRLAQAEGEWKPFKRRGLKRILFRRAK